MEILKIYQEDKVLDKVLRDKAFNATKNKKYDEY